VNQIRHDPASDQTLEKVDRVDPHADRDPAPRRARFEGLVDGRVERIDAAVEIARLDPPLDPIRVDLGDQRRPPFSVAASGWAPPIPPSPAVTTRRPSRSSDPKSLRAAAAKVS
jgi:hypothetical protein